MHALFTAAQNALGVDARIKSCVFVDCFPPNDKDILGCIWQIMNVSHSCNNRENIFIHWKIECSIQLCFASLNGTFHLSTHENILTTALIKIQCILCQAWDFNFERARPLSIFKGQFHWKILKSLDIYWRSTKAKTKGKRGHGFCGFHVIPGLAHCSKC